jgi:glutathione S-transferase
MVQLVYRYVEAALAAAPGGGPFLGGAAMSLADVMHAVGMYKLNAIDP